MFVAFLRASLSKLAGHKYIKSDLIDMDFWAKMPLKLSAVKFYDKSLVKKPISLTLLLSDRANQIYLKNKKKLNIIHV